MKRADESVSAAMSSLRMRRVRKASMSSERTNGLSRRSAVISSQRTRWLEKSVRLAGTSRGLVVAVSAREEDPDPGPEGPGFAAGWDALMTCSERHPAENAKFGYPVIRRS